MRVFIHNSRHFNYMLDVNNNNEEQKQHTEIILSLKSRELTDSAIVPK